MEEDKQLQKIWEAVLAALQLTVSQGAFTTYLKKTYLTATREAGGRLIYEVGCPSAFIKTHIEQRYLGQITEELERVGGRKCEVVFVVKSIRREDQPTGKTGQESFSGPLFEEKKVKNDDWKRANLREDYTLENYAVAGSNQMAFAAAQAVARKPGEAYNPLFIHGGVGVGKTHLMQAIGHQIIERRNEAVLFCSGEEFTNDLVEAIRFKTTEKVRAKYRRVKLLLIDDVQFIAGKPGIQEEFFHTFNALQRDGGQIVMTSDRPPAEIPKLEERLKSRFGAGLIVDIGPADFELRTAILLIKAKQKKVDLSMEIAQIIASNIEGVRELQGFLSRLITEEEVLGEEITLAKVEKLLKINRNASQSTRIITPTEVIAVVGGYYGVGVQQLKGERRNKTVVWPRQILMYLLRKELKLPYEEVGRLVGGRDHSTVIHAENKVIEELGKNDKLNREMGEIKRRVFSTSG